MADQIIIPVIYTEDTSGLSKAAAETAKLQKQTEEFQKVQQQAFEQGAKSVNGMAEGLQDAGAEMADFEATTRDASQTGSAFKGMVRENIRGLTLFGHNLGGIIDNLRAKQVALRGVVSGLGATSGALKVLRLAIIGTGIGALIIALGSLIVFFTKTQAGANKLAQAMAGLGGAVDVVVGKIATFGQKVSNTLGEFAKSYPVVDGLGGRFQSLARGGIILGTSLEALKFIFSGLVDEMETAAIEAANIEAAFQKLADKERDLAVSASRRRAEIEKNRELADDENVALNKRVGFLQAASKEEQKLAEQEIKLAEEALLLLTLKNRQSGVLVDQGQLDEQAQALIRVNNLRADASKRERLDKNKEQALLRQQAALVKRLAEEEKKRNDQRLKIEEENRRIFADLQKNLAQQITDEEQLTKTEQERLEFQRQNAIESLNLAEQELIARAKYLGQEEEIAKIQTDFARLRALTNERFEKEITKVTEEENKKRDESDEKLRDEIDARIEGVRADRLKNIQLQQEIDELRIDAIEKSGNDELTLEQFKEDAKLRLLINALKERKKILEETRTNNGFDDLEIQKLELEIGIKEDSLAKLETLTIFGRIREKFKTLFKLSDEDVEEIGQQFSQITANIFDGLSSLNDAELIQQQKLVDARQENVDALRNQLDEELRLKEQGFANNSDLLEGQLATETALLKKEEEKRLALEKKAANLRLKQDALQIASSIALSVAKAVEANAKFGLVGIVTAAAQIAAIFALIAKAKAQAAEFAAPPKLRQGAKLMGATHEQGGVPLLVNDGNGGRQLFEAEKDEWLIGTKPSKEHDRFLGRVNDNEFSGVDLNKYIDFSSDFFKDPRGAIGQLAPQFNIPIVPDVVGAMLPIIQKTMAESHAANAHYDRANLAAAMGEYFSKVEGGLSRVEKAILEQPENIPLTELGYIRRQKKGNTTSVNVYAPPTKK